MVVFLGDSIKIASLKKGSHAGLLLQVNPTLRAIMMQPGDSKGLPPFWNLMRTAGIGLILNAVFPVGNVGSIWLKAFPLLA